MTDCPPSGRGQGPHLTHFYMLGPEVLKSVDSRLASALSRALLLGLSLGHEAKRFHSDLDERIPVSRLQSGGHRFSLEVKTLVFVSVLVSRVLPVSISVSRS